MLRKKTSKDGVLWNKLSKEEVEELILAYEDSENPTNQIPHTDNFFDNSQNPKKKRF